jgi:hypothetical protein
MQILEVYERYHIMPNLQQHMFRVAGVAYLLTEKIKKKVDQQDVLAACLLHDMGNILKFDLTYFPEYVKPQGIAYWEKIKSDFAKKYGDNVHEATLKIAQELGASPRTQDLIVAIGFNQARQNYETFDFSRKICAYSDMRVAPIGVVPLRERLEDGHKRYSAQWRKEGHSDIAYVFGAYLKRIERQIFSVSLLRPQDVTEISVLPYAQKLRKFEI